MITETRVEFPSEGIQLRGRMVMPEPDGRRRPAVILAHGTSATVEMVMIEFARAFARGGLVALVYDHRNLGRSDGEPRGEINPWVQCRGYLAALDFACQRKEIDPARLALWGDSYSGGQVFCVAACDSRVRAVVAQCPVFGANPPELAAGADFLAVFRQTLLTGDVTGTALTTTGPMPVVSFDPLSVPSLLAPIQAFRWFIDQGGRPGSGWVNRASRVLPATPVPYVPYHCTPFVKVPVLMMVAPEDEMVHANAVVARQAFDQLAGPKHWVEIDGGHFGLLYHPGPLFDQAADRQTVFLQQQLAP